MESKRSEEKVKSASKFEKVAARCWNLLNEGKPFTPIFVVGTMILFHASILGTPQAVLNLLLSFVYVIPLLIIYFIFDFPLFLRNYLWIPLVIFVIIWNDIDISLALFSVALYFFFTVFFWGTLYYHLRIGTSWLNFTRFWKLVLKNSDSTSGNAQEQLPKFLLILSIWEMVFETNRAGGSFSIQSLVIFYAFILVFAYILHRYLFDWKPKHYETYQEIRGRSQEKPFPIKSL